MDRNARPCCEVVLRSRAALMNHAGNTVRMRKNIAKCATSSLLSIRRCGSRGPHASASLSHSRAFSPHCIRLRQRETHRAATRADPLRTQSRRNGMRAHRANACCGLPGNAARHARSAASFASRYSLPRRHNAAAHARELRRTQAHRHGRASPDRSHRPGTARCARRDANAAAAKTPSHAPRKPRRRVWTRLVSKSCGRRPAHSPARHPVHAPLRGTMAASFCLSASSAS